MLRQKSLFVLIIISTIFLFNSGCNLVISMFGTNSPPVAVSCNDYELSVNKTAVLDGKDSYDPDGDKLTFNWSIQSKPRDSLLNDTDIQDRNTEIASAFIDKEGKYEFKLTVSDGNDDSKDYLSVSVVSESAGPTDTPGGSSEPTSVPTNAPTPTPDPPPPYGLAMEYLCNGNACDSSEYQNHGTVYGAQLYLDRKNCIDKAYFFNSGDYIDCGNGYSLNNYGALTIMLWIRPSSLNSGVILSKREKTGTGYELRINSKAIAFSYGELILAASVLGDEKLGNWFHVAVTWNPLDPEGLPILYINGKISMVDSEQPETFEPDSGHLYIGKSNFRIDDYYTGAVDDIRIYDRVLSKEEIVGIMNTVQ